MRIILSNYRYFVSGGPERYLFAIKEVLESKGHDVIPFSVRSSRNVHSDFSNYFLDPIGSEDSTYFNEYKLNVRTITKILSRQFYSIEGYFKAKELALSSHAEVAYSLHFLNKMSPSVLDGFQSAGLKVVARISDFGIICPQGHFFQNGKICEDCLGNGLAQVVRRRCVKDSLFGSIIKASAWKLHRLMGCFDRVDAWVFPSKFTRLKFIEAGMDEGKLHYVPTFVDAEAVRPDYESQEYLLYFGRLVEEKGVHKLLEAYERLCGDKPPLVIIGDMNDSAYSRNLVERYGKIVKFMDFMPKEKLADHIRKAMAVVTPSIWYDNMPNVLLEACAYGKPVIAPDHGCFSDLVTSGSTGVLYDPYEAGALTECLAWSSRNTAALKEMGRNAREYVLRCHSPMAHYDKLIDLFGSLS